MHITMICRSLFSWIRSLESMVASACHDSASEIRKCNKSQRLPDIDRVVTLYPNSVAAWRLHCVITFWNLNLLNYHTNTTDLHQYIFKKAPLFCITMLLKAIFYELSSKHDLPRLMVTRCTSDLPARTTTRFSVYMDLFQNASMTVASLTITSHRAKAIDFTKPFKTLGISIAMQRTETRALW